MPLQYDCERSLTSSATECSARSADAGWLPALWQGPVRAPYKSTRWIVASKYFTIIKETNASSSIPCRSGVQSYSVRSLLTRAACTLRDCSLPTYGTRYRNNSIFSLDSLNYWDLGLECNHQGSQPVVESIFLGHVRAWLILL